MNKKTEELLSGLKTDNSTFMNYLKAKFPLFHNSNIFFRDLEYGIRGFFEKKGFSVRNSEIDFLTRNYTEHLESQNVLIKTGHQSWRINYPEFVTTKPGDPF